MVDRYNAAEYTPHVNALEIHSLAQNDLPEALYRDDTNKAIEILERIKELANASIITLSKTGGLL